jgi:formylglycine-generating enzyme required for sulfatase activity
MRVHTSPWPAVLVLLAVGWVVSPSSAQEDTAASDVAVADRTAGASWSDPNDGAVYRYIPPGSFTMGSPMDEADRNPDEGQHEVTITRAFWMGETEVTQGQWQALMGSNPSRRSSCGASCPVEQVSWTDVIEYANRLSRKAGLEECYQISGTSMTFKGLACKGYRLPTEAEWEYAARAGGGHRYAGSDDLDAVGWYSSNAGGATQFVGGKEANAWGLRDMSGNVREWCWDRHDNYPSGNATDPLGPPGGALRVTRGGSAGSKAATNRVAHRGWQDPDDRLGNVGFRPVRTAG